MDVLLNSDYNSPALDDDDNAPTGAPVYDVPDRKIVAVEHPCIVRNLENGLKLFGGRPGFSKLVEKSEDTHALPLWLRPENPTAKPIMSHHAATNSVLLKIIVPKRTGRKRKRGSDDPFTGEMQTSPDAVHIPATSTVASVARQDAPAIILRKMQDNQDQYEVEAVGMIRDSHRYRGLADFHFTNVDAPFLNHVADHFLDPTLPKLKELKMDEGIKSGPGQEIIPPPHFTDKIIAFNYNYAQNPGIVETGPGEDGETRLENRQGRKIKFGHFIHCDKYPAPTKPARDRIDVGDIYDDRPKVPQTLLDQLHRCMEERPIWTRRSIMNQVKGTYAETQMKLALQLVGYQFRGGPFRDTLVKYGIDPRTDPKYRKYQTVAFKISKNMFGGTRKSWQEFRKHQMSQLKLLTPSENRQSHVWDGKHIDPTNKLWQLCDITDPFIIGLLENATVKTVDEFDATDSGWYLSGFWFKIKTVMKAKMVALAQDRLGSESDDPPKEGYLYNSFITEALSQYSDVSIYPRAITLETLIRPLRDLDASKKHNNRRPEAPRRNYVRAMRRAPGTGRTRKSSRGVDGGDESQPVTRDDNFEGSQGEEEEEDQGEEGGHGIALGADSGEEDDEMDEDEDDDGLDEEGELDEDEDPDEDEDEDDDMDDEE